MYQPASDKEASRPGPVSYPLPPKDYLIWSIVNLVCCFWPLGLVAVIFSMKSRDAALQNNSHLATEHGRTAYGLNMVATVIGVLLIIIFLVVFFIFFAKFMNIHETHNFKKETWAPAMTG